MSTLNSKTRKGSNKTENHEGAVVYKLDPLETLYSKILGSFFGESTFYEKRSPESDLKELKKLIEKIPSEYSEYVLKLCSIGREFNMVSYPIAVLSTCLHDEKFKGGKVNFTPYVDHVIKRPKDIVELMSIHLTTEDFRSVDGKRVAPLPIQLRKQMKRKLESFSKTAISKSLMKGHTVSMADCIKLLRPRPKNDEMEKFYCDVISNDVSFGAGNSQVQSELTKTSSDGKLKKEELDSIISSLKNSSVQAILKNLVALSNRGVFRNEEALEIVESIFNSEDRITTSRLLPFRFYDAFKMCKATPKVPVRILDCIENALDLSVSNMPQLEGYNAYVIDVSGSMSWRTVSGMSSTTVAEIALLMGAIAYKLGKGDIYLFASESKQVRFSSKTTIFSMVEEMQKKGEKLGGGTYIEEALRLIFSSKANYDNCFILSDSDIMHYDFSFNPDEPMQCSFQGSISNMLKSGKLKRVFVNDLAGNDFCILNTNSASKIHLLSGFSEKLYDLVSYYQLQENSTSFLEVIDRMYEDICSK